MLLHWIWFATRNGLNERDKMTLLQHFSDPEDIYYAQRETFSEIEGITEEGAASLENKDLSDARKILDQCAQKDIRICTYADAAYPGRLKNIADPPVVLYYKGRLPDMDDAPVIAAVGTRSASPYGINAARRMGSHIAKCGGIVVSGLAAGIDAAAIAGALSAGGTVIGVLGCGVDIVYPLSNRSLFADTERYGCLLSEFPPGTPPVSWHFPKRNRLMSGLSNGVVVVEAPKKSGALITAHQAAEQGRDVFVVPGNIDVASCAGSNALLRDGAIAVANGWDIISEYENLYPEKIRRFDKPLAPGGFEDAVDEPKKDTVKVAQKTKSPAKTKGSAEKKEKINIDKTTASSYSDIHDPFSGLTDTERDLAKMLGKEAVLVDDLMAKAGLPAGQVLSLLTMLEIKGVVKRLPGKRVILSETE